MKERVKAVRQDANMTQAEFAEALNMTVNAVSQMERDVIKPSIRTRELICDRFNINREWLETGEGEMKKPPLDEVAFVLNNVLDEGKNNPLYNFVLTWIKAYQDLGPIDRKAVDNWMDATLRSMHFPRS